MVFLNPLFLWTLLGLSIPIAIHFWSKKKVKTIKIGSTQLLKQLNPKQTSSIRLNQWFLLLLRMIMITLIALILSVPRIELSKTEKTITYLVEPSLVGIDKVSSLLDTIPENQIRLLKFGFPILEDSHLIIENTEIPDYWQLAQQMETLEADSIIVLTNGFVSGFKGLRPSIEQPILWLQIDSERSSLTPIETVAKNDGLGVTSIKNNQNSLTYLNETYALDDDMFIIDNEEGSVEIKNTNSTIILPLHKEKTHRVLIAFDKQFSAENIYISSGFRALSKYVDQEIQVNSVNDIEGIDVSSFDILVWLKQEKVIAFSGKTLLWEPDDLSIDLIEAGTTEKKFALRHHLNAENSLDLKLPHQLMLLLDLHQDLPTSLESLDHRVIALQEMQVNNDHDKANKKPMHLKDISSWLWALLLLVIPVERILSKHKKQ